MTFRTMENTLREFLGDTIRDTRLSLLYEYSNVLDTHYRVFEITQGRKTRVIEEPVPALKIVQLKLIRVFEQIQLHSSVYGVKGKGAIDNAERHFGARVVLRMDIKKFFPSTRYYPIFETVRSKIKSRLIMKQCKEAANFCFVNGQDGELRLPTGAPTSPIIANISFSWMDPILDQAARENGLTYTRYVDDLTFSGEEIPAGFQAEVNRLVKETGYKINHKKSGVLFRGNHSQVITGVSINGHPTELITEKKYKRIVRAQLDRCAREKEPIDDKLQGKLNYIRQINEQQYQTLISYFERRRQRWDD